MRRFITQKLQHWLAKRLPPQPSVTLNQSNIFILPTKQGAMFILLIMTLYILGTNYQNNLMLLMAYFLLALFLSCIFFCFNNFQGLTIERLAIQPVMAGSEAHIPIRLIRKHPVLLVDVGFSGENAQYLISTIVETQHAEQQSFEQQNAEHNTITPFTTPIIELDVATQQRGVIHAPRIKLRSTFPFGIIHCWTHIDLDCQIIVYPRPLNSPQAYSMASADIAEQQVKNASGDHQDEFSGIKPYQAGEALSRIAWKQSARTPNGELLTKQLNAASGERWITLDDMTAVSFEDKLAQMTDLVLRWSQQQLSFGLTLPQQQIPLNNGEAHKYQCLEAIARC